MPDDASATYVYLDTLDDFTAAGVPGLWGVLHDLDADDDWGLAVPAAVVAGRILSLTLTCCRLRVHHQPHVFRGAGRLIGALDGSPVDTLDCRFHCGGGGDAGSFLFVRRP